MTLEITTHLLECFPPRRTNKDRGHELLDRRMLEHIGCGHGKADIGFEFVSQFHGEQRVAAELEEVVLNANAIYMEAVAPGAREDPIDGIPRRNVRRRKLGPRSVGPMRVL
jgi:hypothetical protein